MGTEAGKQAPLPGVGEQRVQVTGICGEAGATLVQRSDSPEMNGFASDAFHDPVDVIIIHETAGLQAGIGLCKFGRVGSVDDQAFEHGIDDLFAGIGALRITVDMQPPQSAIGVEFEARVDAVHQSVPVTQGAVNAAVAVAADDEFGQLRDTVVAAERRQRHQPDQVGAIGIDGVLPAAGAEGGRWWARQRTHASRQRGQWTAGSDQRLVVDGAGGNDMEVAAADLALDKGPDAVHRAGRETVRIAEYRSRQRMTVPGIAEDDILQRAHRRQRRLGDLL